MGFSDFIEGLDPTTAKRIKTAEQTTLVRLPLASYGMTKASNGGIAKGRIALLYGNTSAGKTLLMMESVAKWQKMGEVCAWVDVEGAYEKEWAARLGVNNDELILIQSKSSGKIEDEIRPLIENKIDALVIDSISDIMPEVFLEKDGSMSDQNNRKQLGAQAKAITALINGILYINDDTAVVLISQTTTFISQGQVNYVKQIPHGGKKAEFASSQIFKITSSNTEKEQIKGDVKIGEVVLGQPIGRHVDGLVEKNKLGPQHGTWKYDMYYRGDHVGIDVIGEIIEEAITYGVIVKAGSWYNWGSNKWQGKTMVVAFFSTEPDFLEQLKKDIAKVEG